jgi:heptosyltransferase-3
MAALFPASRSPRTILVICTRRIGDVLLVTPFVRSLKSRWPEAQIDMLVFQGTGGVLENNPDVRRVILVAQRARLRERFADARRIWRSYDLACAAMTSDRAAFYCWFAGRKRIGIVEPAGKSWFKRLMFNRLSVDNPASWHTVQSALSLAPLLGIAPCPEVVAPGIGSEAQAVAGLDRRLAAAEGKPIAVLHPYPMYAYKMWHDEGWLALIDWLHAQGYAIVLTGGPAEAEVAYAQRIEANAAANAASSAETNAEINAAANAAADAQTNEHANAQAPMQTRTRGVTINLAGQLSLGETAETIRRAQLFVGPDTSVTHIAAATGTPTIALFGPSNPVRWAPWPKGWSAPTSPWPLVGSGRHGQVYLLQGTGACVPCKLEGCEAHIGSWSDCLLMLDANRVIDAAADLLGIVRQKQVREAIVSLMPNRPQRRGATS